MSSHKKIHIAGIPVTIISDEEAEKVDAVVCGSISCFPDDVSAWCSKCGTGIVHRPHVPKTPPKICLVCAGLKK